MISNSHPSLDPYHHHSRAPFPFPFSRPPHWKPYTSPPVLSALLSSPRQTFIPLRLPLPFAFLLQPAPFAVVHIPISSRPLPFSLFPSPFSPAALLIPPPPPPCHVHTWVSLSFSPSGCENSASFATKRLSSLASCWAWRIRSHFHWVMSGIAFSYAQEQRTMESVVVYYSLFLRVFPTSYF